MSTKELIESAEQKIRDILSNDNDQMYVEDTMFLILGHEHPDYSTEIDALADLDDGRLTDVFSSGIGRREKGYVER